MHFSLKIHNFTSGKGSRVTWDLGEVIVIFPNHFFFCNAASHFSQGTHWNGSKMESCFSYIVPFQTWPLSCIRRMTLAHVHLWSLSSKSRLGLYTEAYKGMNLAQYF